GVATGPASPCPRTRQRGRGRPARSSGSPRSSAEPARGSDGGSSHDRSRRCGGGRRSPPGRGTGGTSRRTSGNDGPDLDLVVLVQLLVAGDQRVAPDDEHRLAVDLQPFEEGMDADGALHV